MTYRARCARRSRLVHEPRSELYVLEGRTPKRTHNLFAWAGFMMRRSGRFLAETRMRDGRRVVSLFLGISAVETGAPLVFETCVVRRDREGLKIATQGWSPTWKQMMRLHHKTVDALRARGAKEARR